MSRRHSRCGATLPLCSAGIVLANRKPAHPVVVDASDIDALQVRSDNPADAIECVGVTVSDNVLSAKLHKCPLPKWNLSTWGVRICLFLTGLLDWHHQQLDLLGDKLVT